MCAVCSEGRGTSQQLIPPQRETLPNGDHRSQRPGGQSAKDKQLNPRLFQGLNKTSDLHIWGGTALSPPAGWRRGPGVERGWCCAPQGWNTALLRPQSQNCSALCFVTAREGVKDRGGQQESPQGLDAEWHLRMLLWSDGLRGAF